MIKNIKIKNLENQIKESLLNNNNQNCIVNEEKPWTKNPFENVNEKKSNENKDAVAYTNSIEKINNDHEFYKSKAIEYLNSLFFEDFNLLEDEQKNYLIYYVVGYFETNNSTSIETFKNIEKEIRQMYYNIIKPHGNTDNNYTTIYSNIFFENKAIEYLNEFFKNYKTEIKNQNDINDIIKFITQYFIENMNADLNTFNKLLPNLNKKYDYHKYKSIVDAELFYNNKIITIRFFKDIVNLFKFDKHHDIPNDIFNYVIENYNDFDDDFIVWNYNRLKEIAGFYYFLFNILYIDKNDIKNYNHKNIVYKYMNEFNNKENNNVLKELKETLVNENNNSKYEMVNHPSHYNKYDKEVIDMMINIWGKEQTAIFCKLNAFKYRMRMGTKPDNDIKQDLEKELWYLKKYNELIN